MATLGLHLLDEFRQIHIQMIQGVVFDFHCLVTQFLKFGQGLKSLCAAIDKFMLNFFQRLLKIFIFQGAGNFLFEIPWVELCHCSPSPIAGPSA